jgi:hypothetical protein
MVDVLGNLGWAVLPACLACFHIAFGPQPCTLRSVLPASAGKLTKLSLTDRQGGLGAKRLHLGSMHSCQLLCLAALS